jgi:hypothetical protein
MNNEHNLKKPELLKILSILGPLTEQRKRINSHLIEHDVLPSAKELEFIGTWPGSTECRQIRYSQP